MKDRKDETITRAFEKIRKENQILKQTKYGYIKVVNFKIYQ